MSKCTPLCKAREGVEKLQVDNLIDYVHLTLKRASENQTQNSIETFQLDYFVPYIPLVLNGWARCEMTRVVSRMSLLSISRKFFL